ncbi:hypothetical protein [Mesorhizobium sp. M0767]|uniref:tyrosine-type recombinase/integrase n=1 Tax=Mesorhizobium sp. M0767 TaxID=2956995 RepID=UPI0033362720
MSIAPNGRKFLVTVRRASAKEGFRRIRKAAETVEAGKALEAEINQALDAYGMWPVPQGQLPLDMPSVARKHSDTLEYRQPEHRTGTLREAAKIALATHWAGMRSHGSVEPCLWRTVHFMERLGKVNVDDIKSADLDALVTHLKERGNVASYINQQLGSLRVVNKIALKRLPALATVVLPIPHLKTFQQEKWWLRPELHLEVTEMLRKPGGDPLFADLIDIIIYQGLRVEETIRLEARQFSGLGTPKPWLQPDGTKTVDAQNSIPVYPEGAEVAERAIARAAANNWPRLFPITAGQASQRWNLVRDYLGVTDIPTATLKSLRRTFAWYANQRGMPTETLRKVMRHRQISTTSGYLRLIGDADLDKSRDYFEQTTRPAMGSGVGTVIAAYAATGASPEAVARFAKEMMA